MTSVQDYAHMPAAPATSARRWPARVLRLWLLVPLLGLPALAAVLVAGTGYVARPLDVALREAAALYESHPADAPAIKKLDAENRKLARTLARKVPDGNYLVIDQTNNRIYLKHKDELLLKAVCSAGSGFVLSEQGGKGRRWIFDTPRGRFKVLNKMEDPVWKKPDWAFIEEGKPLPKSADERIEYGMLGEYALYFGNGYMVHGTLYENLLGRSVTHGCIRVGRDDLRRIFQECPIGTPIYIY
jgi:L,D-transpeptidase ErfK/SrfK